MTVEVACSATESRVRNFLGTAVSHSYAHVPLLVDHGNGQNSAVVHSLIGSVSFSRANSFLELHV